MGSIHDSEKQVEAWDSQADGEPKLVRDDLAVMFWVVLFFGSDGQAAQLASMPILDRRWSADDDSL